MTGDAELADEVAGAADAEADAKAAAASGVATPAEGEAKEKKEETARPKRTEEEEEEDNTQSYAEYLAAKASAAIEGVASLTKRVVEEWTGEGAVVKKEGEDAFFAAKEKKERALKARKEKNTVRSFSCQSFASSADVSFVLWFSPCSDRDRRQVRLRGQARPGPCRSRRPWWCRGRPWWPWRCPWRPRRCLPGWCAPCRPRRPQGEGCRRQPCRRVGLPVACLNHKGLTPSTDTRQAGGRLSKLPVRP